MLTFLEFDIHDVAAHTRLHRDIGDGHNRAEFGQDLGHVAGLDHGHRNGARIAIALRACAAPVAATARVMGCAVRAQKRDGKKQNDYPAYHEEQAAPPARLARHGRS
ncbi:hypothetical protein GCM10007207_13690 [Asaia siamensis]|uniref:Uncharacterized protein n=1 Tax=Asaia siamensis TaxID=110479 RepID=A0ABQ1LT82_9PROT|nr:hypothetical protein AA0323_0271 [Asaia siamensis NRIC 0323]GGC29434.1 hypothetical protein GCM10007207_13690 [Asaia siamensis]